MIYSQADILVLGSWKIHQAKKSCVGFGGFGNFGDVLSFTNA